MSTTDKEVTPAIMTDFIDAMVKRLGEEEWQKKLNEKGHGASDSEGKELEKVAEAVQLYLHEIQEEVWGELGVDGKKANILLSQPMPLLRETMQKDEAEGKKLQEALMKWDEAESDAIRLAVLGEEKYKKSKARQDKMEGNMGKAHKELIEAMQGLTTMEAQQKHINSIQQKAMEVSKKLRAMKEDKVEGYVDNMSWEEQVPMLQLRILSQMQGGGHGGHGGHGHSHGGKPCGGHGAPSIAPEPTAGGHGHSHGGKPCGGHGAPSSAPEPTAGGHGHSHGGKPCGGHGGH